MSYTNLDQVFHGDSNSDIAKTIARILRDEYGGSNAALKRISNKIDANQRTVKNWYEGNNTPNLEHFIKLVKTSPKMLAHFLLLCGYDDLAKLFILKNQRVNSVKNGREIVCYSVIFDTNDTNVDMNSFRKLNQRRLWFYSKIGLGNKPNARTLSEFWSVSLTTAKRDIAFLTHLKLVGFVGSKRGGFYVAR